jgi:ABC-type branched-subunit amino acid transport system ATPase component/ABC-type branched-subunit amino acid transport system permease subunit
MLAAGLSGLAALLAAPIVGPNLGAISGPEVLLAPLTAAVVAQMDNLPLCVITALGIGVFEQGMLWNYPRSTTVDLGLFVVVIVALLLQRRRYTRVAEDTLASGSEATEVRPIPDAIKRLPEVRAARIGAAVALAAVLLVVPIALAQSTLVQWAFFAVYGILAVSLVVLTGWGGQISLGQFAFAGVGAATTAALLVSARIDLFIALIAAAFVGAITAALIGLPALRIPGLFLAVATLAFGVPVSTWLLNYANFPTLTPSLITRPILFKRYDLHGGLAFYYLCLAGLALAVVTAWNFRRTRPGRALIAVRENERAAAAFSISPMRQKLTAFAFSGALAGLAGGLYAVAIEGMPFGGFPPLLSLLVFTMVVIGGAASLLGALVGTLYFQVCNDYLHGAAQLLATGGGLVVLLMFLPGGMARAIYWARDRALVWAATRRGLSVPTLTDLGDAAEATAAPEGSGHSDRGLVVCHGVDASYGHVQVLFGVDVAVEDGEIVALLGTNGAGKSTVLRVIAGLMPARAGTVVFDGRDITRLGPVERVRAGLVTVPGGRGVFGSLTVDENLRLGGWLARGDDEFVRSTMGRIWRLFPRLADRRGSKASLLSGGEQQMLTIAMALLCRPKVLMVDELSLGLAPAVVAELLDVMRNLNAEGVTVIVVEQSLNVATDLAHNAVFMEKGQVRFRGPMAKLVKRPDLARSVFLRAAASTIAPSSSRGAVSGEPALEIAGVSKAFGGVVAVDDITLDVRAGEVLGIIGPNGSGKTTLLDVCSGFLPADHGTISFDRTDVTGLSPARRADLGLGRVFQDARLFPGLTVRENIAVALERHIEVRDPIANVARLAAAAASEREVQARVAELIETVGLPRYADAFVAELSTGTRRIVELACALAHQPSVLLLDEPSSGIAQRESEALAELLLGLRDTTGAAMVVIEHDIPLVSAISDDLCCLHLGRVIARGPAKAVLSDPEVVACYLGRDRTTIERSGPRRRSLKREVGVHA